MSSIEETSHSADKSDMSQQSSDRTSLLDDLTEQALELYLRNKLGKLDTSKYAKKLELLSIQLKNLEVTYDEVSNYDLPIKVMITLGIVDNVKVYERLVTLQNDEFTRNQEGYSSLEALKADIVKFQPSSPPVDETMN
jgi:hypothetical protein